MGKRWKDYIKRMAIFVLVMFMLVTEPDCFVVNAAAANGIYGNGTQGIWININASPYTDLANVPGYGQQAYGPSGCAWFASSRAKELTGKGISTIYSGASWYNSSYSNYGFRRGNALSDTEKALACYKNHVSVVEKVEGDTVYISEGGFSVASYASYGYCRIAAINKSTLMSSSKDGGFLGFVYLGVPMTPYYNPEGCLDSVEGGAGFIKVAGWGLDRDNSSAAIEIHVYIGGSAGESGAEGHRIYADKSRQDVDNAVHCGANHGFEDSIATNKRGEQDVWVYAINIGSGDNTCLGKRTVTISEASVYLDGCDEKGYMVACQVENPSCVSWIKCATWETTDGQNDLEWRDMSCWFDGNVAKLYVPYSEHEVTDSGIFENHIYINNVMVGSLKHYLSKKTISDGRYHILLSADKSYGINIEGRQEENGTNANIYKNAGDNTQTFDITYLGNGYYKILLSGTDKSIDVTAGDKKPKANLQLHSWNDTDAQKWMIVDAGDGTYKIISKCSDKLIDVSGGVVEDRRNLWLYNDNNTAAQKWEFEKVSDLFTLKSDSAYNLSGDGFLTGIKLGENTVKDVCGNFSNDNLICRDSAEKVLSNEDILGTGSTICMGDGTAEKVVCTVIMTGDIYGDGKIDGKDVSLLLQHRLGKKNLTEEQTAAGDVYKDGKIDGKDVSKLLQYRLGKTDSLE